MRSHEEFWQAVFRRAGETLVRDNIDLQGWTLELRAADDPEADAKVKSPGGFVDAMLGHADIERRVLTLFLHEMVWDEAAVSTHTRAPDSAGAMATWWLVESLRSIDTHLRPRRAS